MGLKSNKFFIFLAVFISFLHILAYRVWLFSSSVLTHGDWYLNTAEASKELLSLPSLWKTYSFGTVDLTPPFYPFMLIEGFLANLNISYAYIERIIFIWPITLGTILFSFILIRSITKNNIASIIGAVFYSYNTYFIIIQTGHLTLMSAYMLFPLVIYLFRKALYENSFFYSLLTGFIVFVLSFYEFRAFYIYFLFHIGYYTYYVLSSNKPLILLIKRSIFIAFTPLIIVGLLNMYWIFPMILITKYSLTPSAFSRDLFGNEFFTISKSLALFHPFWNGGKYVPFIVQSIPIYFFIIPLSAILGLLVKRENKEILFFSIVALIGVFLSKQSNPLFADIYTFFYSYIPGFSLFREASKFYLLVSLGYSVLIAALICWVWENWKKGILKKGKYFLCCVLLAVGLLNLKPLVTGEMGMMFATRDIPKEYLNLNEFINSQPEYFRTLWVPVDSRWAVGTSVHPKARTVSLVNEQWYKYLPEKEQNELDRAFINIFNFSKANELLDLSSVKYVIVPLQDTKNDDDFFKGYGISRNMYIEYLDNTDYLTKLDVTKNIIVYENQQFLDHFYTTLEKELFDANSKYGKVSYQSISTTTHKVVMKNIKDPVYLHFSDSYHPDWAIRIGNFNWFDEFIQSSYFIPDEMHYANKLNFNSFFIDPNVICEKYDCIKNLDGSYDINLTVYFKPQSYMYLGLIVSVTTLLVIISLIVYSTVQKIRYEK